MNIVLGWVLINESFHILLNFLKRWNYFGQVSERYHGDLSRNFANRKNVSWMTCTTQRSSGSSWVLIQELPHYTQSIENCKACTARFENDSSKMYTKYMVALCMDRHSASQRDSIQYIFKLSAKTAM